MPPLSGDCELDLGHRMQLPQRRRLAPLLAARWVPHMDDGMVLVGEGRAEQRHDPIAHDPKSFPEIGRPAEALATSTGARNRAGLLPPPVAGFTELVNVGLAAKLFVSRGASTPGCPTGCRRGREEMTMRDAG